MQVLGKKVYNSVQSIYFYATILKVTSKFIVPRRNYQKGQVSQTRLMIISKSHYLSHLLPFYVCLVDQYCPISEPPQTSPKSENHATQFLYEKNQYYSFGLIYIIRLQGQHIKQHHNRCRNSWGIFQNICFKNFRRIFS